MAVKIAETEPQERTTHIVERERPVRLLIIGRGLVGKRLIELSSGDPNISSVGHEEVDVTNIEVLRRAIGEYQGDTVVNCAAYTDVEEAQKQSSQGKESRAYKVNADGARNMAMACRESGKHLIQFSSDFVFPGTVEDPGPYAERHPINPGSPALGFYAYTKAVGELETLSQGAKVSLIRIAYPSKPESGFHSKVVGWIKAGYSLFGDQVISPTLIDDLVPVVERLSRTGAEDIFHVASPTLTTPYEYALAVNERLHLAPEIKSGSLVEFMAKPGRTPKPVFGGLSTRLTEQNLGVVFTNWKEQIDLLSQSNP